MQLTPPPDDGRPPDLAAGLATAAVTLGHRPAVTVLSRAGRAEQGYATLAQWAAKGAHMLLTDVFAAPGDSVLVDLPPGWPLAAVCAAVWWTGAAVTVDPDDEVVAAVVHESRATPAIDAAWLVGDQVDGGVEGPTALPAWAEDVQAFPDEPPARAATPDGIALRAGGLPRTHGELVAELTATGDANGGAPGTLGVDLSTWSGSAAAQVALIAARPLVTARTTLVLADGLPRDAAAGDRVTAWA